MKDLKNLENRKKRRTTVRAQFLYHHCVRSENWMFTSQRISGTNNTYKIKHKQQNRKSWEQEEKWNESQNTFL